LRRYHDFCDFPDGGCRHLEFSKIRNFNGLYAVGGQYASLCQISSKSVQRLPRYGDLMESKSAALVAAVLLIFLRTNAQKQA